MRRPRVTRHAADGVEGMGWDAAKRRLFQFNDIILPMELTKADASYYHRRLRRRLRLKVNCAFLRGRICMSSVL